MNSPRRYRLATMLALAIGMSGMSGMPAFVLAESPASIQIGTAESVRTLRVDGEVVFDTAGKVVEHRILTPGLPDAIRAMGEKTLADLQFVPVKLDGRPVNARTFARMTYVARQQDAAQGDGYSVSMEYIRFYDGRLNREGGPSPVAERDARAKHPGAYERGRAIHYPGALERVGISGAVLLHVLLRPDGTVERVQPYQSALFDVKGKPALMERARAMFENEAKRAVASWRFAPPKRPEDAVDDSWRIGAIPVLFAMEDRRGLDGAGKWRIESRGARHVPSWGVSLDRGTLVGVSDLDGSEGLLPVRDQTFRLKSPPAKQ